MNLKFRKFLRLTRIVAFLLTVVLISSSIPDVNWQVDTTLADNNFQRETIFFSQNSLVTHQSFTLTLTSQIDGTVHYTLNGSAPNANSPVYSQPIFIDTSTIIQAQLFDNNDQPVGDVYTKSYIVIEYEQTIPIISIVTDWTHLDDLHHNSQQRGDEWERPISIEYFTPDGQNQFNVYAGLRIHGGQSRQNSIKKSYRIYFRKSYDGPGMLNYPLFEASPVTEFDKLVLRAGFNDSFTYANSRKEATAQTYTAKYIGDQVVRNLHSDMGQPIAHGKWVLLYLNGEYWGLYNLTERIDLQYFRSYSDENSEWDVIKKEVGFTPEGEWIDREAVTDGGYGAWQATQDWVGSADFYNPGNIGVLEWMVDKENLFSYMFLQAYVQNYDWPGNNWIIYRRSDSGATDNETKWRLMVWDAERSFGSGPEGFRSDKNTLLRVYSPHDSITRLLEKPFIGNCAFKHKFVQRSREYLGVENSTGKPETAVGQLSKDRVKAEILEQAAIVRPYIQMEVNRWAPDMSMETFDQNVQNALTFVDEREAVILHHLDELRYQTFTDCQ